jgi:iron(III) transport system substrate-binding protein
LIVAARNVVIVYNTEKVPANMVPKTIEDLADPKYKGMIGTTPYGTGWGEIGLIFGQDYAFELAKKIAPNIAGYTGSSAFEPVITGQLPIFAFTTNGDMARAMSSRGAPLGIVTPFIAYLMGSVNMIKGAANPNAARLFTIFLRTPEGQKILRTVRREDSPFVEGSNAYQTVADARAAGKRVLLYTEDDVIKNSDIFEKIVPKINRAFKAQGR